MFYGNNENNNNKLNNIAPRVGGEEGKYYDVFPCINGTALPNFPHFHNPLGTARTLRNPPIQVQRYSTVLNYRD